MITFYPVLRQHMREHGITYKELAAIAGISRFTLTLTMWGIREWKLPEAVRICCFFKTTNAEKMFLQKYNK